jgi:hypothetical protein
LYLSRTTVLEIVPLRLNSCSSRIVINFRLNLYGASFPHVPLDKHVGTVELVILEFLTLNALKVGASDRLHQPWNATIPPLAIP